MFSNLSDLRATSPPTIATSQDKASVHCMREKKQTSRIQNDLLITDEFSSSADVGWYGAAFIFVSSVTQAPWGFQCQMDLPPQPAHIRARIPALCPLPQLPYTYLGRGIAGFGGSGIGLGIYTIIGVCVPPRRRPKLIGVAGLAFLLASFASPVIGGEFNSALLCFRLGLEWGVSKSWNNKDVTGCLVGFPVLMGLFIANEFFWDGRAMIPHRLLFLEKKKGVALSFVFVFLVVGAFFMLLFYMPIYFQTVKGNSDENSGIRTLPLVMTRITGYPTPFLLVGGRIISVGVGLLYTLDLPTQPRLRIPYQILAEFETGASLQVPIIMNQANVDISDISTMTSAAIFFICLGASIFMQAGQTRFLDKVKRGLDMMSVANVSSSQLLTGWSCTGFRTAYLVGLKDVFVLVAVLSGLATFLALFVGRYKLYTVRLRL
ncbi:major facilitator superfamily domain-containing protein [Aspergillus alliaceus]|uniref:major facilitator superfamily domain-containing protein n=1 Tax=Petromyces alliaceus TaxID=209559 RepID=UPI0012A3B1D8|nr:major facilitator superfamily domain-containing protein [Aspergillus alliaceus]KAB8230773.1 major facilitator superfamily domain-containing protein [Aspergillus alliaceus]